MFERVEPDVRGVRAPTRALSLGVASQPARFAADIAASSEAGGSFDTDNLISNEASYCRSYPRSAGGR